MPPEDLRPWCADCSNHITHTSLLDVESVSYCREVIFSCSFIFIGQQHVDVQSTAYEIEVSLGSKCVVYVQSSLLNLLSSTNCQNHCEKKSQTQLEYSMAALTSDGSSITSGNSTDAIHLQDDRLRVHTVATSDSLAV